MHLVVQQQLFFKVPPLMLNGYFLKIIHFYLFSFLWGDDLLKLFGGQIIKDSTFLIYKF